MKSSNRNITFTFSNCYKDDFFVPTMRELDVHSHNIYTADESQVDSKLVF